MDLALISLSGANRNQKEIFFVRIGECDHMGCEVHRCWVLGKRLF